MIRIKSLASIGRALAWVLLVLLACEALLRLFVRNPVANYAYDEEWGRRPAAGTVVVWGTEGYGVTRYVNDGEVATPYSGGENIVVLGDSHTAAPQVSDAYNYVSVAERKLWADEYDADLRNLGAAGFSLADYVYFAPYIMDHYKPGIVVIQMSDQDFWSNDGFNREHANYFIFNADGSLGLKHRSTPRSEPIVRFKNSLALMDFGYVRFQQIRTFIKEQPSAGAPEPDPSPISREEMIRIQLAALRKAYQDVDLVVILLPYVPRLKDGLLEVTDDSHGFLVDEIQAIAEWSLVDPLDSFIELGAQGQLPRGFSNTLPGEGHLNVDGHQVLGTLLAAQLEEILP
jgi:lysophospholipase L1-like esterase